jgi:hypothetical protein
MSGVWRISADAAGYISRARRGEDLVARQHLRDGLESKVG